MSKIFTLDSLKEAAEKKYAPTKIQLGEDTVVELRPVLRLGADARERVKELLKDLGDVSELEDDESEALVVEAVSEIIYLVCDQGKLLVEALDGDLGLSMHVLETWLEDNQVGEANSSES